MKEKIRHLIALKVTEKGLTKMSLRSLVDANRLTEEAQNYYLDKLRSLDEEIEILEKVLRGL